MGVYYIIRSTFYVWNYNKNVKEKRKQGNKPTWYK